MTPLPEARVRDLATDLRGTSCKLRRTPLSIADVIPLLLSAADVCDELLALRAASADIAALTARCEATEADTARLMFVTHNYKRINFWGMNDDQVRAAIDEQIAIDAALAKTEGR